MVVTRSEYERACFWRNVFFAASVILLAALLGIVAAGGLSTSPSAYQQSIDACVARGGVPLFSYGDQGPSKCKFPGDKNY